MMRQAATLLTVSLCASQAPILSADTYHNVDPANTSNIIVVDKQDDTKQTASVTKLGSRIFDVPFSVETIQKDLIEQYDNGSLATLLGATSSALVSASEGGNTNEITLRGFSDTAIYRNGINDSFADKAPRNLVHIERIEILKGPSSALYGPGEPGGVINFVTKQPEAVAKTTVSTALGSNSLSYLDFDSTGPLPGFSDINYRLIGSTQQSDSFRDFVKSDSLFLTGGVNWLLNNSHPLSVSIEYSEQEILHDSGILASTAGPASSQSTYFGEPSIGAQNLSGLNLEVTGEFSLKNRWTLNTVFSYQHASTEGASVEPSELIEFNQNSFVTRELQQLDNASHVFVGQLELNRNFQALGLEHSFIFGAETTYLKENNRLASSNEDLDAFRISVLSPVYSSRVPALFNLRNSKEQREQYSLYAQDLMSLGEKWRLLASGRFDYIKQRGTDTVSRSLFSNTLREVNPRVGLVYDHSPPLAFFASYSTSLDPNEGLQASGEPLTPTRGKSVEVGAKWKSLDDNIALNISLFRIRQTNITTDAPDQPGFEVQTAEQRNIGLDVSLDYKPFSWLTTYTNYNYLDSEISGDSEILDGTPALNVPRHRLNLLGLSTFSLRKPEDTKLGLNFSYVGARQGSLEPQERLAKLEDYIRADLFISHRLSTHLLFSLRIENLGDTVYIQNSQSNALRWIPGKPRTVIGQLKFDF